MTFLSLDLSTKKLLLAFLSCLFCWWLLVASGTCSASGTPEPVYQITETELVTLENNLAQLSSINTKLQADLTRQSQEATQLRQQLSTLQKQLEQLQQKSQKQEASLISANKLLDQYATEEKRTRLRVKAQRNTYFTLMIAAAAFAVCHR